MITNDRMIAFIDSFDKGNTPFLEEIEKEARAAEIPVIRPATQSLLRFLMAARRPMRILEVGTAVGFSALLMSEYAPEGAHVTTIEKYEKRILEARKNFKRGGREERITLLEGDAAGKLRLYFYGCGEGTVYPIPPSCAASAGTGRDAGFGQCAAGR